MFFPFLRSSHPRPGRVSELKIFFFPDSPSSCFTFGHKSDPFFWLSELIPLFDPELAFFPSAERSPLPILLEADTFSPL